MVSFKLPGNASEFEEDVMLEIEEGVNMNGTVISEQQNWWSSGRQLIG